MCAALVALLQELEETGHGPQRLLQVVRGCARELVEVAVRARQLPGPLEDQPGELAPSALELGLQAPRCGHGARDGGDPEQLSRLVPDRGEAGLEIEQSAAGERAADRPPLDALTAPRPSEQGVQLLGPGALRQLRDRPAQGLRLREPEDPLRGRVPAMRPSGWVERIASRAWRRMLVRRGSTLDRRRRFELRERFVRGLHGHELETRGRRHRAQASRLLRILGARDEERDVGTHGDARGEAGKT